MDKSESNTIMNNKMEHVWNFWMETNDDDSIYFYSLVHETFQYTGFFVVLFIVLALLYRQVSVYLYR